MRKAANQLESTRPVMIPIPASFPTWYEHSLLFAKHLNHLIGPPPSNIPPPTLPRPLLRMRNIPVLSKSSAPKWQRLLHSDDLESGGHRRGEERQDGQEESSDGRGTAC
jgi:hypothetical protein